MLVKVAIDLSLDRLFDYRIPEELEKKLAVGQLLSVPFGHRSARGFAMELCPDSAAPASLALKPVSAVLDPEPFFSPRLIELARLVAARTASPIESVLRAAVPAAVLRS
ncbi:MAG: primosomal protein N', partial [Kiritimatiellae bacterium]|nr:primosomal protein N' [Kiritimatiellia bacterium]